MHESTRPQCAVPNRSTHSRPDGVRRCRRSRGRRRRCRCRSAPSRPRRPMPRSRRRRADPRARDHDVARVDLEEAPQRLTSVGSPHAVGAERVERAAPHELTDLVGHDRHEIGDRRDRARRLGETSATIGVRCSRRWVEPIVAFGGEPVLGQRLVRRDRPQLGGDPVVLGEFGDGFAGRDVEIPENRIVAGVAPLTSGASGERVMPLTILFSGISHIAAAKPPPNSPSTTGSPPSCGRSRRTRRCARTGSPPNVTTDSTPAARNGHRS